MKVTPLRLPPPRKAILPGLPLLHRKRKRKPRTNQIKESLSIAIAAANHPDPVRKLSEAGAARENADRGVKRRGLCKERAKADRNEQISKKDREEAEKRWKPYAPVIREKAYTKLSIPTHNQLKRYLL